MVPGAYEVSLSGPIPNLQGPGANSDQKLCIRSSSDTTPKLLVSSMLIASESCDLPSFKREGNRLTGKSVCPVDPQKATGEFSTSFDGTIGENAIDGVVAWKMDVHGSDAQSDKDMQDAKQLMEGVKLTFKARRVGDCDGSEAKRNAANPQKAGFGDDTIEGGGPVQGSGNDGGNEEQ